MVKIEQIEKSFQGTSVLRNISFEISKGDFIAIMGPSGSGKSTLLYSISGLDSIDSGKVFFDGTNIVDMREEELTKFRLNRMGFVFQNAQMIKNLSVFDNIILPGLVAKKESADAIRERADKLMESMGIEDIMTRDIHKVSGGQLQRASICRAMINNPDILFLDEPTGALNSSATDQVLQILKDLNEKGTTIMTVTHDPRVAAKAKRVIYIMDGQIAASKQFVTEGDHTQELDDFVAGVINKIT